MPPRRRPKVSNTNTKVKKTRKTTNQSSQLLAEWEDVEGEWCQHECNQLSRALTQSVSTSLLGDEQRSLRGSDDDHPHFDGDTEPLTNESDIETSYEDESDASVNSFGGAFAQMRGAINRKRRIRGDRQWAEVIQPMFKAFMKVKLLTREWSHSETWNQDFKAECRCSIAKKHIRQIDIYDILSRYLIQYISTSLQ